MAERLEDRHTFVSATELISSMATELKNKTATRGDVQTIPPTIYKVPDSLRQGEPDAYNPKLISIGPLHRDSKQAQLNHTDIKWNYLQDLINRDPEHNSMDIYVEEVWKVEQRVRKHYSVKIDMESDEFVKMLVLDGCFILEFLIKRATGNAGSPWKDAKWYLPMLRNDLFLLENQIPFFVVKILFDKSRIVFPEAFQSPSLLALALHYVRKEKEKGSRDDPWPEIHHLLHLNYLCQLRSFKECNNNNTTSKGICYGPKKYIWAPLVFIFYYLISMILMCKRPRHHSSTNRNKNDNKAPRSLPSAKKLWECGLKFRVKDREKGKTNCYLNVSFSEEDGMLEIPHLSLQQNSTSSFRNLIALEQCCPGVDTQYFTAYAVFMDKIIDTSEDVAILVKHGIIESKLGTDEDVAKLFNNICKGASLDYDKHYLVELFKGVNRYCDFDRHRWRAALVHGYFHNPWAVASFLAAIILLLLTFGSTVATIEQTVFTIKGYKKQYDEAQSPH